ncbi:MAG: hypothetical protein KBS56_02185 [Clostridiales bacterium]|nr:hypothetical protein [Candidatus Crickella equi]
MKNYPEVKDSDPVYPLRYSEAKDWYRVPYFCEPSRLSWLRSHSDKKYYIRQLDVGIYEIGSIHGGKVPNAKKIKVECPDHQFELLEAVDSTTLFCGLCAPHKYVKNGEILKKCIRLAENGAPLPYIPED